MNEVPSTPASEQSARSQDSGWKARDDGGSLYKVILVPIDFSECSKRTLQFATHIAIRENASIWLLHVFRVPDYSATIARMRLVACIASGVFIFQTGDKSIATGVSVSVLLIASQD